MAVAVEVLKSTHMSEREPNQVPPEKRTEHTADPQGGVHGQRHPENATAKEGLVKGDYSHLLHEPKINSTRHPLPKDVAAFDHHFADGKKKKADKKS